MAGQPPFVVLGPGAVGLYLAGLLARGGAGVRLLDHDPARAARLAAGRARLLLPGGREWTWRPRCVAAPAAAIVPGAFVFVCVKAWAVAGALRGLGRALRRRAAGFVLVHNGMLSPSALAAGRPGAPLFRGLAYFGVERLAEGVVRLHGPGPLVLAPLSRAPAAALAALLAAAGIEARAAADPAAESWTKLIVNAVINPLTALYDLANGKLLQHPAARRAIPLLVAEGAAVARAAGVSLGAARLLAAVRRTCRETAGNSSSMRQDLRAGRRTEIEYINGFLAREGARLGVPVCAHAALLRRVREQEQGKRSRAGAKPLAKPKPNGQRS